MADGLSFKMGLLQMLRVILILCMAAPLTTDVRAEGVKVSYAEWVKFAQVPRAACLAGILDHILYFEDETAVKWEKCIGRSKKTLAQITDDLADYAERSAVTYNNVPDALWDYVSQLCPDLF
jgi:hypothetical protein